MKKESIDEYKKRLFNSLLKKIKSSKLDCSICHTTISDPSLVLEGKKGHDEIMTIGCDYCGNISFHCTNILDED